MNENHPQLVKSKLLTITVAGGKARNPSISTDRFRMSLPKGNVRLGKAVQVGGRHYLRMGIRFPSPPKFGL